MCWCAAEQTCANPPDFSATLGLGPQVLKLLKDLDGWKLRFAFRVGFSLEDCTDIAPTIALGFVDFGGPLPDVVYRCFEWEACEIEALDGTSLSPLVKGPGSLFFFF